MLLGGRVNEASNKGRRGSDSTCREKRKEGQKREGGYHGVSLSLSLTWLLQATLER